MSKFLTLSMVMAALVLLVPYSPLAKADSEVATAMGESATTPVVIPAGQTVAHIEDGRIDQIHNNGPATDVTATGMDLDHLEITCPAALPAATPGTVTMLDSGTSETDYYQCLAPPPPPPPAPGPCFIAYATEGTDLKPQLEQFITLRNAMIQTKSTSEFIHNTISFYLSFSPTIVSWEKSNPLLKDGIRVLVTPLLVTTSIITSENLNTEENVLFYSIITMLVNVAIYIIIPSLVIVGIAQKLRNRVFK